MNRTPIKTVTQGLFLYLCIAMTACSSLQPVNFETGVLQRELAAGNLVQPGDRVLVISQNGEKKHIEVDAVTHDALVSKDGRIMFTDIVALETREFSAPRTWALAGGMLIGSVALITTVLSAAFVPAMPL